jgi:hypothetical protein
MNFSITFKMADGKPVIDMPGFCGGLDLLEKAREATRNPTLKAVHVDETVYPLQIPVLHVDVNGEWYPSIFANTTSIEVAIDGANLNQYVTLVPNRAGGDYVLYEWVYHIGKLDIQRDWTRAGRQLVWQRS